jgi:hypothetical protein
MIGDLSDAVPDYNISLDGIYYPLTIQCSDLCFVSLLVHLEVAPVYSFPVREVIHGPL